MTNRMKNTAKFLAIFCFIFNASAEEQRLTSEQYIDMWKVTAIEQMNSHAIPASITLAQGILESGSGNSELAKTANNHFGIKCHTTWNGKTFYQDDDAKDECFRSYDNAALSYEDHSLFLTTRDRYAGLFQLKLTDYSGWAKGLKSAGYATNPKYAELLITIIEKHNLAQYDLMPNLPGEVEREKQKEELTASVDKDAPSSGLKTNDKNELEVSEVSSHKIALNKNKTRYIIVQNGDTFYRISKEFNIPLWQLYKFNELGKRDVLKSGEIIYLDPKRFRASRGSNVYCCERAMTLREVSQIEGIKVSSLMKYNFSDNPDEILPKGTKVILR
jgi:hypothetical protein